MEKKHAIILAILITLLIFSNYYFISNFNRIKRESVLVTRVIDGDTLEIEGERTLRLVNINTPEKSDPGYEKAKEFLKRFENKTVEIEVISLDRYKRELVRIYDEEYVNLEIVKQGLANKFLVQKNELNKFEKGELEAVENFRGIWNKSEYFGCLNAEINRKEEFVTITNECNNIDISRWSVKDESRKTYKFKSIKLDKSEEIMLYTKEGKDTKEEIYWNSKTDIWNNDRDSIYIKDSRGNIVFYESYGY